MPIVDFLVVVSKSQDHIIIINIIFLHNKRAENWIFIENWKRNS